jgi:hypothetical protein
VVVPLSFFWSSAVRDFALFFVILAAIFYFEWLVGEVQGKMTERLDSIEGELNDLKEQTKLIDP